MQNKTLVIIAVILGVVALTLVSFYVFKKVMPQVEKAPVMADTQPVLAPQPVADTEPAAPKYKAVVAKTAISNRTVLSEAFVEVKEFDSPQSGAVTTTVKISDYSTKKDIAAGAVIMTADLHKGGYNVVAAAVSIPPNTVITSDMVELKTYQIEPVNYISNIADVINNVTKYAVAKDKPLTRYDVFQGVQLSHLIPVYKRAITIQVNQFSSLNYLIKQGDIVDILVTFDRDFAGVEVTKTIAQSAEILAIERSFNKADAPLPAEPSAEAGAQAAASVFNFISLGVTPLEAEKITFAITNRGEIRLALRSPIQRGGIYSPGTTKRTLFGSELGRPETIEIYKGARKEVVTVQ